MPDIISTIQDGLVEALAALDAGQSGGYLRRRAAFNGTSVDQITEALGLVAPAVVVSFLSADIDGGPFIKRDDVTLRFNIWCADRNLRGQEASAQGSGIAGETPGCFGVVEGVIEKLRQQRFQFGGRETLGVVFTGAKWIPAEGGLAVVRLDCEIIIPQVVWS